MKVELFAAINPKRHLDNYRLWLRSFEVGQGGREREVWSGMGARGCHHHITLPPPQPLHLLTTTCFPFTVYQRHTHAPYSQPPPREPPLQVLTPRHCVFVHHLVSIHLPECSSLTLPYKVHRLCTWARNSRTRFSSVASNSVAVRELKGSNRYDQCLRCLHSTAGPRPLEHSLVLLLLPLCPPLAAGLPSGCQGTLGEGAAPPRLPHVGWRSPGGWAAWWLLFRQRLTTRGISSQGSWRSPTGS